MADSAAPVGASISYTDGWSSTSLGITLVGGGHSISGTLSGRRSEQRIVSIDDHTFDVPPTDYMMMVKNDDRPGVIGVRQEQRDLVAAVAEDPIGLAAR